MERNQSKVAEVITELILAVRLRQSRKVIFIIGREPGSFSATGRPTLFVIGIALVMTPAVCLLDTQDRKNITN